MAVKKYLLVCEGPSDIEILDAISKAIKNVNGHTIEIAPLSPQMDKTSGQYPSHGWTAVRDWCLANRPKSAADVAHLPAGMRNLAMRKNWNFWVAVSGADGLIVQIDTDIAELISDQPQTFAASGMSRRAFTEFAV